MSCQAGALAAILAFLAAGAAWISRLTAGRRKAEERATLERLRREQAERAQHLDDRRREIADDAAARIEGSEREHADRIAKEQPTWEDVGRLKKEIDDL